jgi:eukaryotic-like serine/threonine-protein kinase
MGSDEQTQIDERTEVNDSPNLVGTTLDGRYYIEQKLGSGGIGDVYLARDKPELLSRRVVIKVLQEKALKDEWIVTKFRQEGEALTRIDDPGVVGLLDAGTLQNGHPYLVMQFVEGENLRTQMRPDRGMEFGDVAHIWQQVGRSLTAAHDNEVIHRDLKPENVMVRRRVDGNWQVKVIDFGIAKIRNSLIAPSTVTGKIAGTVNYMSPEQLQGKKVSAVSDVYALGVIAYEMVTGRCPFNPETPFQLSEMQKAGAPLSPRVLRPGLPVAAQDAILKALAYRVGDRYQRARDFGDDLARALLEFDDEISTWNKSTAIAPAVEAIDQMQPPAPVNLPLAQPRAVAAAPGRRKFWLAGLAVLVIALLAVAAVWRFGLQSHERRLTYWLNAKMKDKKTNSFSTVFPSTGTEVFNNGSEISFHIEAPEEGSLYIINEGPGPNGASVFNILFPNPTDNHGSARLPANQRLDTYSFPLDESEGTETQWIVWAAQPLPELEDVYRSAFPHKGRVVEPDLQQLLKEFLVRWRIQPQDVTRNKGPFPSATISASRQVWAFPLEISHRDINYR